MHHVGLDDDTPSVPPPTPPNNQHVEASLSHLLTLPNALECITKPRLPLLSPRRGGQQLYTYTTHVLSISLTQSAVKELYLNTVEN